MNEQEKYFDDKNYITKIIKSDDDILNEDGEDKKAKSLVELLTLPENKDFKEEALLTLKKENAGDLLIEVVKKNKKNRAVLIAACWESEINFSKYLSFFIPYALDDDYFISLEAITVIGTMEGPFDNDEIVKAIEDVKAKQKQMNSERVVLYKDLIDTLQSFKSNI
jgi:hypothetical protein